MFAQLYGIVIKARNSLYEKKVFKSFSLGVPTVSVGNITVGGTGKTPLVALVAEILDGNGEKVAVLSRGYGRDDPKKRVLVSDGEKIHATARQSGDEPFELARKLLGKAVVIADANRASAGIWARDKFGISAFVLDDAFQHRRVGRDVNIVTIDATNPFGNEKLLPTGILREPLENLKRADAIVLTRANLSNEISSLKTRLKEYNSTCPIFVSENKTSRIIELKFSFQFKEESAVESESEENHELRITNYEQYLSTNNQMLKAKRGFAFCALGNPNNFFEQLRQENFNLVSTEKFPDHHFYRQKDIAELELKAKKANAEITLTTAKDAVKLKDLKFDLPCLVVESEMIFDGENDFPNWLTEKINAAR